MPSVTRVKRGEEPASGAPAQRRDPFGGTSGQADKPPREDKGRRARALRYRGKAKRRPPTMRCGAKRDGAEKSAGLKTRPYKGGKRCRQGCRRYTEKARPVKKPATRPGECAHGGTPVPLTLEKSVFYSANCFVLCAEGRNPEASGQEPASSRLWCLRACARVRVL